MRWRIDKEVLAGKGQFICGEKKCNSREGLKTWEVNFGYVEHGVKKNALVKLSNFLGNLIELFLCKSIKELF